MKVEVKVSGKEDRVGPADGGKGKGREGDGRSRMAGESGRELRS